MIAIRQLGIDDWRAFRKARLAALTDSPGNFFRSLGAEPYRWPDGQADENITYEMQLA